MEARSILVVAIFIITINISTGPSKVDGIRCWDCNSDSDPQCADPFDNQTRFMKDCKLQDPLPHYPGVRATMCRKIRQKVGGRWRYFRSCAYLGEPGIGKDERYCLMITGTYNIFSEYCTCRGKDGCNSGPAIGTNHILLAIGLFAGSYLFWRQ